MLGKIRVLAMTLVLVGCTKESLSSTATESIPETDPATTATSVVTVTTDVTVTTTSVGATTPT